MSVQFGFNISKNKSSNNPKTNLSSSLFTEEDDDADGKIFKNSVEVNEGSNLYFQTLRKSDNNDSNQEIDSSVYEYDEIYDEMKKAQKKQRAETEEDREQRKPKYMDKFFELAAVRERDRLRAQEKMLQIERQAEGNMYDDKEKFVTDAYKKQQEELTRLEEEENAREALMRKKSKGISSFYRNILDETEREHDEVIKAISKPHKTSEIAEEIVKEKTAEEIARELNEKGANVIVNDDAEEIVKEKTAEEIARELNEKGANVIVNDDGEVVDKRQLLSAGLNIAKKSIKVSQEFLKTQKNTHYNTKLLSKSYDRQRRERESMLIQEQIKKMEEEREEEERLKYEKLVVDSQQKRSSEEINKIRERYLKRKAELLQDS
ncbi:hypothetical protein PORY_001935 [Pneumocystis oryctolagi]|uniref:Uncharacterized protein n=1 Tax=Pneumocystis oryctolagi TaxID=42067 RepID=A0ACB7CDH8_9ASCO|nr:hypothetical protein PORY_001935 [Pneumocystis oryctolagi]